MALFELGWQHFEILLLLAFLTLLTFRLNTVVCPEKEVETPASEVSSNPMLLWFDLLKNTQNIEHYSYQGPTCIPRKVPGAMKEELQPIWKMLL